LIQLLEEQPRDTEEAELGSCTVQMLHQWRPRACVCVCVRCIQNGWWRLKYILQPLERTIRSSAYRLKGPAFILRLVAVGYAFCPVNANEIVSGAAGSSSNLERCTPIRTGSKLQWLPLWGNPACSALSPSGFWT